MSVWQKRAPNTSVLVPDWDEPCTDVLQLPGMLLENGKEGYYRAAADGPLGKAAEELCDLYKAYCRREPVVVRQRDGTSVESEIWRPDEDLLVSKLYGQAFDPDMRIAFARCLLEIGANPAEIIATGERVLAAYIQEEADRMTARAVAREKVDRLYGDMLPRCVTGKVHEAVRDLLIQMTMTLGRLPEVWGEIGTRRELLIALKDIEAMIQRKFRGARLPRCITRTGRRYFMTLNCLALFGLEELRDLYLRDEENERVADLYYGLNSLQYHLMNSNPDGRKVLDGLFNGLFGGGHGD